MMSAIGIKIEDKNEKEAVPELLETFSPTLLCCKCLYPLQTHVLGS
jgi:hypothetical protein